MGSVEQRGKNRFRLSIVTGYDDKGNPKRLRKTVTAKNKTEARKLLSKFEADYLSNNLVETTEMRLKDYYPMWLEKYAMENLSADTRGDYINIINSRVLTYYGHIKLKDIRTIHIVDFVDDLKRDGRRLDGKKGKLSASTIRNCYKAFNSLLKCAHKWNLIPTNPAEGVELPSVEQKIDLDYSMNLSGN